MDAELKAKWVKALRSGEYEQGKSYFENNGKFCCLGVLCAVAGTPRMVANDDDNWQFVDSVFGDEGQTSMHLADMNDSGESFFEIADYIEANL